MCRDVTGTDIFGAVVCGSFLLWCDPGAQLTPTQATVTNLRPCSDSTIPLQSAASLADLTKQPGILTLLSLSSDPGLPRAARIWALPTCIKFQIAVSCLIFNFNRGQRSSATILNATYSHTIKDMVEPPWFSEK